MSPTPQGSKKPVRAWAREHGYQVSDRGPLPRDVLDAYDEMLNGSEASSPARTRGPAVADAATTDRQPSRTTPQPVAAQPATTAVAPPTPPESAMGAADTHALGAAHRRADELSARVDELTARVDHLEHELARLRKQPTVPLPAAWASSTERIRDRLRRGRR